MKTRARGHVERKVGVVHAMQPPERRNGMEEHVLQVDGEIERHDAQQYAGPSRHADRGEQPPPLGLRAANR